MESLTGGEGGLCWLSAVLAVTVIIDSGGISTVDLVNGS